MADKMMLKQVRDVLEYVRSTCFTLEDGSRVFCGDMADAIDAHLNAAKGEAVAEISEESTSGVKWTERGASLPIGTKLYTHPYSPEDARRLDWLEQGNTVRAMESDGGEDVYFEAVAYFMSRPFERIIGTGSTPREAIDAAMVAREGRE